MISIQHQTKKLAKFIPMIALSFFLFFAVFIFGLYQVCKEAYKDYQQKKHATTFLHQSYEVVGKVLNYSNGKNEEEAGWDHGSEPAFATYKYAIGDVSLVIEGKERVVNFYLKHVTDPQSITYLYNPVNQELRYKNEVMKEVAAKSWLYKHGFLMLVWLSGAVLMLLFTIASLLSGVMLILL
ncbi:MAG TPA: hypothetical protein PK230_05235 [Chitinophagales bacterium]|nr:hypothetical protein [Chitinophagales bacterium]